MRRPVKYTLLGLIPVVLLGIFTGFFLCGSFFLTRVVLPAVSARAGIDIVADRVVWSPFTSHLTVEKLRIGPADAPCFSAGYAEFTYALQELVAGTLKFSDIRIERGDFTLFRGQNGWSCYRPVTEAAGAKEPVAPVPAERQRSAAKKEPPRFDLARIRIDDSRLALIYGESGAGGAFELSGLSGSAAAFRNGVPFAAELAGRVKLATSRGSLVDHSRMTLAFEAQLDDALQLKALKGRGELNDLAGRVGGVDLAGGALSLELESRESRDGLSIDRFHLEQSRHGVSRSVMDLTGSVRRSPFAVAVNVSRGTVSPEMMAIFSDLSFGFNPGHAVLECRGKFFYGNRRLSTDGMLRLTRSGDAIFGLERIDVPDFRLDVEHRMEVDFNASRIDLARLSATVVTEGKETASLRLRKPVRYSWKEKGEEARRSAEFDLIFDRFDLSQLRFVLPPDSPLRSGGGKVSAKMQLLFRHNLSSVGVLGNGRLTEGHWRYDGRLFPADEALFGVDVQLRRNLEFRMNSLSFSLRNRERETGALSCSGRGSLPRREAELKLRFERLVPEVAEWFRPGCVPVTAAWRKLELSPADLRMEVAVADGGETVHLRDFELTADRGKARFAALRISPFSWFPGSGSVNSGPGFTLRCAAPAAMFNPLLAERKILFHAGRFLFGVTGRLNRQLDGGVIDGECSLDEVDLEAGGKRFSHFGLQNRFSLYCPDFSTLEVKAADFYLRHRGRPALRLEAPGIFHVGEGRYRGEWQLRYFNEQFLTLLEPKLAAEAQFSGRIQVSAQNHFESFRAAGALECSRWLAADREGLPFNGRLLAVFESSPRHWTVRNFQLKFNRAERLLADFTGECRVDRFRADRPVSLRLSSRKIELGELLKLFSGSGFFRSAAGNDGQAAAVSKTAAADRNAARKQIPLFWFGVRPVDFGCRFEKLILTPELAASLEGRFRLKQGDVYSEYLKLALGGAQFDVKVRAASTQEGIRGNLAVRGNDRMPCRPLLEFLSGVRNKGFEGVLTSLDTSLNWLDDGSGESFLASLSGYFRMKLRDVVIPNGISNSLFGRLFLLPVDLAGQLSALMPEELSALSSGFLDGSALRRVLRTLRLSSGELDLSADRGEVMVRECCFLGDWIDRINFTGAFQLGGDQNLQLESQLLIAGIPLTVPVRGTLTKPAVSLEQGAVAGIEEFMSRVRKLKLFDLENGTGGEPTLLIHDLSPKETLRELRYIFDGLFKRKR